MNQDESHLRLLSIFYYVLAAGSALFSSIFLFHFLWGLFTLQGKPFFEVGHAGPPTPPAFGIMLMAMGGGAVAIGWGFAVCLVIAGRSLKARTRHTYCIVIAAIACLVCNPLGTVLGAFTIVVLLRPSVKELFGVAEQRAASG